jgi:hypothetical protein
MKYKRYCILCILFIKVYVLLGANQPTCTDSSSFFIVDTLYENNYKIYRQYVQNGFGFYFISVNSESSKYLLGIPLLKNMETIDYKKYKDLFGQKEYYYEYPIDSKNPKGIQEVYFAKKPKCFLVCLIQGAYYNKVSHWIDGPDNYPFKDENAYYIVYVPIWDNTL